MFLINTVRYSGVKGLIRSMIEESLGLQWYHTGLGSQEKEHPLCYVAETKLIQF